MKIGVLVKIVKTLSFTKMAKDVGYDFVLYDNEHGFFEFQELHDLCLYAKSLQLDSIVRISEITKTEVCKTLDAGARGILVPMVEGKEDVDRIVELAKYPPLGKRGYAGGANTNYSKALKHSEAIGEANANIKIFVQIETKKGVQHAEEIVSHPHITGVVIGPADLAISLDCPGEYLNIAQIDAMNHVAELCKFHHKKFGIIGNDEIQNRFAKVTDFVVSAIDVDLVYNGLVDKLASMRNSKALVIKL